MSRSLVIAIPCRNEASVIRRTLVETLLCADVLRESGWETTVVVAENGSSDDTAAITRNVMQGDSRVRLSELDMPGKGNAVRHAWQSMPGADAYMFMDADLAVALEAVPRAIRALESGADVVIGSRAHPDSAVTRTMRRTVLSKGFSALSRVLVGTSVRDLPCGFKMVRRDVLRVLPAVKSGTWFFDSELVLLAERQGYVIQEIPVRWRDGGTAGRVSHVPVFHVAGEYLRELARVRASFFAR